MLPLSPVFIPLSLTCHSHSSFLDFFVFQNLCVSTRVDFFYNGVHHGSDTRAGWAEPGVNGLSNSLRIRFWQSNIPIPNSGYENLRIWRGVRTEEQIRDNMHRILNKEDHPTLDCDFRFDEDITSTTFYDNYGHDSQGIGRIEVIGTSEGYATKSMRIASGQGLDSFTNITMLSDPAVSFELPMKGGDADGDAITFELTSHSPELTIINDDLTTDLPYFEARPTSDIDEPLTVFYEYRTLAGGQVSLRTRTYLELLPLNPGPGDDDDANPGSSNPFVYVGLGSFLALLIFGGLVGRAKTNNGDDEALLEGGAKGQGTAGGAIAVLLDKFSVSELNLYVTHMLSKGNYDSALALALSVEQKAVGGAATDYLQAVDNVGAALFYCGFTDAIAPVKQARRTTMGMKGKVRQSQLVGKQIGNAKSAVKRKTLLKKPQDDVFEVQTVAMSLKNPTGKAPPVSVWMDGKDSGKKQGKKNGKKR